jgi:hypothetical protein
LQASIVNYANFVAMRLSSLSFIILFSLASCMNSKDLHNDELKTLQTNGIYIAHDPYSFIVRDEVSMKPVDSVESIKIIRFINEHEGVLISWSTKKNVPYTKAKIRELYGFSKTYEKQYPEDKDYVHFVLLAAPGDSIRFMQSGNGITTTYFGLNYADSLVLNHKIDLDDKEKHITPFDRKLTYRFYSF